MNKLLRWIYHLLAKWSWIGCLLLLAPSIGWGAMYGNNIAGGTFFIDTSNSVARLNAAQNTGRMIKVVDIYGRQAVGWKGPAGTVEGLSAELITVWNNDVRGGIYTWETLNVNANGHDIDLAIHSGDAYALAFTNSFETQTGGLLKWVILITAESGVTTNRFSSIVVNNMGTPPSRIEFENKPNLSGSYYLTVNGNLRYGGFGVSLDGSGVTTTVTHSIKKVLTPGASGCSIFQSNLTTNSWERVDADFDWNNISYYAIRQPLTLEDWKERPGHVPGTHRWRVIR